MAFFGRNDGICVAWFDKISLKKFKKLFELSYFLG
jgi:hypothetical protein